MRSLKIYGGLLACQFKSMLPKCDISKAILLLMIMFKQSPPLTHCLLGVRLILLRLMTDNFTRQLGASLGARMHPRSHWVKRLLSSLSKCVFILGLKEAAFTCKFFNLVADFFEGRCQRFLLDVGIN